MAAVERAMNNMTSTRIDQLKSWASKNPHSAVTLKRSPPMLLKRQDNEYVTDIYKFVVNSSGKTWSSEQLDPAGILSYILWRRDPLYRVADTTMRRHMYNEALLDLQQEMESGIAGTKFSRRRRKMVEVLNGSCKDAPDIEIFDELWAQLLGLQFVKIATRAEAGKRIRFVPAAVDTWSAERPIIYVDENFESVFEPPEGDNYERRCLARWISDIDIAGWTIKWPVAEGTKDELDAAVIPMLSTIQVPEKAKKAELAVIVGRYNAIKQINELSCAKPLEID
jgi:hypothetical protein